MSMKRTVFAAVCISLSLLSAVSAYAEVLKFDISELTAAADKEEMKPNEVNGFTISGSVLKRRSKKGAVISVELSKNEGGAISFHVESGAAISVEISSTGDNNKSELAIKAEGAEEPLVTEEVTGATDGKRTVEYKPETAGTYVLYSPKSSLKRGVRVYTITVSDAGEIPPKPIPEPAFIYGDANADGKLQADDSAYVLQKVLSSSFRLPIEDKTADFLTYIDVDGGGLSASDSAQIMQKVLNSTFKMPVEK